MVKPRVVIGHPMMAYGGSELKVLWGIQALRADFALTVITCGGFDLDALNEHCCTAVQHGDFTLRRIALPRVLRLHAAALRGAVFLRAFRQAAQHSHLAISAYAPCDLGTRAIQCIADFSWHETLRRSWHPAPPGANGLAHRYFLVRRAYLGLCRLLQANSLQTVLQRDAIIANSHWSAAHLNTLGAQDVSIIHPPVVGNFPAVPWDNRKLSFICLGRVVPEKRIEEMVTILEALRQRGRNISLRIVGSIPDDDYGKRLRALFKERKDWVEADGPAYGKQKSRLLSQFRFGLHACVGEAFGIGVAELVKAGCIVFAPKTGGPAEILDHEQLTFGSIPDAVEKIDAVLRAPALQARLLAHLAEQAQRFTTEHFMSQFRRKVEDVLRERRSPQSR